MLFIWKQQSVFRMYILTIVISGLGLVAVIQSLEMICGKKAMMINVCAQAAAMQSWKLLNQTIVASPFRMVLNGTLHLRATILFLMRDYCV